MKKPLTPAQEAAKAEQKKLNRLWHDRLAGFPELIEDLEKHFQRPSMIVKDKQGRTDGSASFARFGSYEVLEFIRQRLRLGAEHK